MPTKQNTPPPRRPDGRSRPHPEAGDRRRPDGRNRQRKKKSKVGRIILFTVEIVALVLVTMFLYTTLKVEKSGRLNIAEESIIINQTVREHHAQEAMKGFRTVALFGVDSTTGQLAKNTRTDTIMIASINLDNGEVRLVSVYRDTYLNLGNDRYNKANAAYANGGPEQAINMLNMNMDLNITDFVTVGFKGLVDTIDALGGIMIDVTEAEIVHLNNYQATMAKELKRDSFPVRNAGRQRLDGLQATAYCRIRFTAGDDFRRAERNREVLRQILDEAKKASPATISKIATDVFGSVLTSFDLADIISLLGDITKYKIVDDAGFPTEALRTTGTIGNAGSCVVPIDLTANVIWLHQFLFGFDEYTPSNELKTYSDKIKKDTSPFLR